MIKIPKGLKNTRKKRESDNKVNTSVEMIDASEEIYDKYMEDR